MKALIIEDDRTTARTIQLALACEGFYSEIVSNSTEGWEFISYYGFDIVVLDVLFPGDEIDGFKFLLKVRKAKIAIPIIIVSTLCDIESKVKAFGFGADDYLTKPFNRTELIARIQAIIRRSRGHPASSIKINNLVVHLDSRTVECNGAQVHLTGKEYAIVELLALRRGQILNKELLLNHLYGGVDEPEPKIIDVFICKLRKKLASASGGINYIQTQWGQGYKLEELSNQEPPSSETKTEQETAT